MNNKIGIILIILLAIHTYLFQIFISNINCIAEEIMKYLDKRK